MWLKLFLPQRASPSKTIAGDHFFPPLCLLFPLSCTAIAWETDFCPSPPSLESRSCCQYILHKGFAPTSKSGKKWICFQNKPQRYLKRRSLLCDLIHVGEDAECYFAKWNISLHFSVVHNLANLAGKRVMLVEKPGGCVLWRLCPDFLYLW